MNTPVIAGAAAVGVLLIVSLTIFAVWWKRRKTPRDGEFFKIALLLNTIVSIFIWNFFHVYVMLSQLFMNSVCVLKMYCFAYALTKSVITHEPKQIDLELAVV